jgi:hypothetical protein
MRCHVVVATPQCRQRKGRLYNIRIDLTVPRHEIVVNREPLLDHAYEDVEVAIREAFNAAVRQLEDHARRMRSDTKTHAVPPHGRVKALFPEKGYGFIESSDGLEIYFHRNSVVDDEFPAAHRRRRDTLCGPGEGERPGTPGVDGHPRGEASHRRV